MTAMVVCAEQIERGEHLADQASWLSETHKGKLIYDGIASAIEARRAETAQTGSVADESAVPTADAQTQSPSEQVKP
jgi:hypothetical protein